MAYGNSGRQRVNTIDTIASQGLYLPPPAEGGGAENYAIKGLTMQQGAQLPVTPLNTLP